MLRGPLTRPFTPYGSTIMVHPQKEKPIFGSQFQNITFFDTNFLNLTIFSKNFFRLGRIVSHATWFSNNSQQNFSLMLKELGEQRPQKYIFPHLYKEVLVEEIYQRTIQIELPVRIHLFPKLLF